MKVTIIICSNRKDKLNQKIVKFSKEAQTKIIFVKKNPQLYYQKNKHIEEIIINFNGVSKARNLAINKHLNKTDVFAFTDDDCVPDKNWLKEIKKNFKKKQTQILFGKTMAYKARNHKYQICPSVFSKKNTKIVSQICPHWQKIGFSNNMAIRSTVFKKIGLFKWWLGPGSIGSNGEDAELILRMLINHYQINYDPKMIVFHNKWLRNKQFRKQLWSYSCGGIAAYGYYFFLGVKECKPILKDHLRTTQKNIQQDWKSFIKAPQHNLFTIYSILNEIIYALRGIIIAFMFATIIPRLNKKQ